jgi:hypothetical protein
MKHASSWFLPIAALVAAAGCVAPDDVESSTATQAVSGLEFEIDDDTDVAGAYYGGDLPLRFASHTEWGRSVQATIVVGETPIVLGYEGREYEDGVFSLDVRGRLDERERRTLLGFAMELDGVFPYERDVDQPNGALLRIYAGFLSEWTLGPTPRPVLTRVNARMKEDPYTGGETGPGGGPWPVPPPTPPGSCGEVTDDDGITVMPECCNGGGFVVWDHDALPGECFHSQSNICGASSAYSGDSLATDCPGRCGPGCFSTPTYTRDCLEHDLCLMHHPGQSSTSSVGVCGDELGDAVNDVVFLYVAVLWWGPLFHTQPQAASCFI